MHYIPLVVAFIMAILSLIAGFIFGSTAVSRQRFGTLEIKTEEISGERKIGFRFVFTRDIEEAINSKEIIFDVRRLK